MVRVGGVLFLNNRIILQLPLCLIHEVLSGLSVSASITDDVMTSLECSGELPGAVYTLDDLAALRLPAMKFAYTTCKGRPSDNTNINIDLMLSSSFKSNI